ncbi:uncharacterized protein MONBRDRAFT_29649, partial [Monosiga brevicollis MX1]
MVERTAGVDLSNYDEPEVLDYLCEVVPLLIPCQRGKLYSSLQSSIQDLRPFISESTKPLLVIHYKRAQVDTNAAGNEDHGDDDDIPEDEIRVEFEVGYPGSGFTSVMFMKRNPDTALSRDRELPDAFFIHVFAD